MNYLNINQVLAIHSEVIEQTGGSRGIRDIGLVNSAVARPRATFDGKDLYPDIFSKAAHLGHSLITAREYPVACYGDESAINSSRNKILRGLLRSILFVIILLWMEINEPAICPCGSF